MDATSDRVSTIRSGSGRWSGFVGIAMAIALLTGLSQPAKDDGPNIKKLQGEVSAVRGLEFRKDVPALKQDLKDFESYLDEELEKIFPGDSAGNVMDGLVRLGLLKEAIDIGGEFKQALLTQAGAYYDPVTGTFYYLMVDLPGEQLETIAAHELVHALQDQHFDLGGLMKKMENDWWHDVRNDDRILAARSLVEGEATYVQMILQMKQMAGMDLLKQPAIEEQTFKMTAQMPMSTMVSMAKMMIAELGEDNDIAKAIHAMEDIPPYIMEPLYAAYMGGAYFTMKLRHHGGWEEVAGAYREYPLSSEQTLHPEKYLDQRDDPTLIDMPELKALGAQGWTKIDAAIHGEFYLGILLRMHGMGDAQSRRSSAGWDGDIYHAYRHTDGRVMFAMVTTWDDANSAERFGNAYLEIVPAKLGIGKVGALPAEPNARQVTYDCEEAGGFGQVLVRDREVFIVEGVDQAMLEEVMNELRALRIAYVE